MAGESRVENDLYRRGGKNQPRQHGGGRGESRGEPRRTTQRISSCLDRPKDTEEEAQAVKGAIGDAPFLLSLRRPTLPRAMIFFRHAGLIPCPRRQIS